MRRFLIFTLLLCLASAPAFADSGDAGVYMVTDVAVDVTADSAAHARDKAITEAQRTAFAQLLERLSADTSIAAKLKDDDLAALVQNFEVQSEHRSSVRYIGVLTVQFRPNAVRKYLAGHNVNVVDARSKPILILPIYLGNGHPILWEETTRWRTAWEKAPHDDGLVPVKMPSGGLEDIAAISTEEAVAAKSEALKALADKYQAGSAAVVTLNGNVDNPAAAFTIDITRVDADGSAQPVEHLTLPAITDKNAIDAGLAQGVKQVRHQLEKDWLQSMKQTPAPPSADGSADSSVASSTPATPSLHLPVTVPVATLAEWAEMRRILDKTPGVLHVDLISVGRGEVRIELELSDSVENVQTILAQQRLMLNQEPTTQAWVLRHA